MVDPPGYGSADQTSLTYDPARGNLLPLSRTDPLIGVSSFTYDAFNRRASVTDPNGVIEEFAYDDLDRMRFSIRKGAAPAEDRVYENIYNAFGDLHRIIEPEGNIAEYGYDDVGRMVSVALGPSGGPLSERTLYTLDAFGNQTREELQRWDGAGWVTHAFSESTYSSRCRLDKITYSDGSQTELGYDCNGNLERVWDANHPSAGQTAQPSQVYTWDALNRLTAMSQPWAGEGGGQVTTTYSYDVQDHLIRVVDPEGNRTRYIYSDRNRLTERISDVSGRTTFAFNDHGELVRETDARQITLHRTVDAMGRVLFIDYPDNSLDTTYTYDDPAVAFSKGRLTAITRGGDSVAYGYDRFGRLIRDGDLGFAYDRNDNRVEIGYPSGIRALYTYDFANRHETLTVQNGAQPPQAVVTGSSYLPSGPLSRLDLGNGLTEVRDFDQRHFPLGIAVSGLLDWDYGTDSVGNVLGVTDTLHGGSRSYDYLDHLYFLRRGDGPWGDLSWTHDKLGNRLIETRDGVTSTYRYEVNASGGRSPRLLEIQQGQDGVLRYFYDAAGNRTYEADGETKQRLDYDGDGRLAQITIDTPASASDRVNLQYDGRGFLTSSRLTPSGQATAIATTATYDSRRRLYSKRTVEDPGPRLPRDEASTITTSHVLYFSGRPVGIFEDTRQTDTQGQTTESERLLFITTDHLGTPALVTDAAGAALWQGGFEPFGAALSAPESAGLFLRLPGQWQDPSWMQAGLSYNVHRWYEPSTGRYNRPEPLGLEREVNLYLYAQSAPTVVFDPDGLATQGRSLMAKLLPPEIPQSLDCMATVSAAGRLKPVKFGDMYGWRYQHCLFSCILVKNCGLPKLAVQGLGNLIETKQILECVTVGDNCHSAHADQDYKDNRQGRDCPPDVNCFENCQGQWKQDKTPEQYGPFTGFVPLGKHVSAWWEMLGP